MTIPAAVNLIDCFDSLGQLLGELDDDAWRVRSLCPDWDVHGVVAHVIGIEQMLQGWTPSPDFPEFWERLGAFAEEARSMSPAALLDRYRTVTAARAAELRTMSDADFELASFTPIGVNTYGRFMAVRTFDVWVHEQDVRVPLGRPGHLTGPAAEMALDEIRGSFGYIAGKKVGVPDGASVAVNLTGPLFGDVAAAVVDGRAKVLPVADPTASITTDSLTFALLACGRIDPDGPIADGRVTMAGDPELAGRLARQLRFTF